MQWKVLGRMQAKERFHLGDVLRRSLAAEQTWSRPLTHKVKNRSQELGLGGAAGVGRWAQVGDLLSRKSPQGLLMDQMWGAVGMTPATWSWPPSPAHCRQSSNIWEAWGEH